MEWKQIPNESWLGQKQDTVQLLAVYERVDAYSGDSPFRGDTSDPYEEMSKVVECHRHEAESIGGQLVYTMGAPACENLLAVKVWIKANP